ncbi:MAG: acyl-CoA thioester hydrolase/BAAT C-terminal domain-containing protein [Bacteroidota bacterium]
MIKGGKPGMLLFAAFLFISSPVFSQIKLNTAHTESILYLGDANNQPLIVGLGGSEGGNAWASDYWKSTRDQFIEKGYAFLAIGYFGVNGTPPILDKIAIEDLYDAIKEATKNRHINKRKIAIIGGSRGADLALLLGSYYQDISCVIGLVASNAVFPGHTDHFTSSCWTYGGKELPFVPVNEAAIPFLMKHDLRGTFEAMLKDSVAEEKARIKVENINGPVLLISATEDEICPSTPMSEKMIARLKANHFKFNYKHIALKGSHAEATKHFELVFDFLERNFAKK